MPVRKIGLNSRSMTGRHGFTGQQYESALERDFLDLVAFDLNVERAETQPLKITYIGPDGEDHPYTPDALVWYRRDVLPARDMPHLLVEVKYRQEYRDQFHELKHRFRAARRYARERGWQFRVLTEREIRTPYLKNAQFLRPYRDTQGDPALEQALLNCVREKREATLSTLLDHLSTTDTMRARYLSILLKLIASFQIGVDLTQKLDMNSRIWACYQPDISHAGAI